MAGSRLRDNDYGPLFEVEIREPVMGSFRALALIWPPNKERVVQNVGKNCIFPLLSVHELFVGEASGPIPARPNLQALRR